MGNTSSISDATALVAMARTMALTREQLTIVRTVCGKIASKKSRSYNVSRRSFRIAMAKAEVSEQDDVDVLDHLFTLWDEEGEDRLNYRDFCAGISPLACGGLSIAETLEFALQMMDIGGSEMVSRDELSILLEGISATASYLGDDVLTDKEIDSVVHKVFSSEEEETDVSHKLCIKRLHKHPLVVKFVAGKLKVKHDTSNASLDADKVDLDLSATREDLKITMRSRGAC